MTRPLSDYYANKVTARLSGEKFSWRDQGDKQLTQFTRRLGFEGKQGFDRCDELLEQAIDLATGQSQQAGAEKGWESKVKPPAKTTRTTKKRN